MDTPAPNTTSSPSPSRRNRRLAPRKNPRGRPKVECLRGTSGVGRNLALAMLDVSETGTRLRLCEELPVGQEVELSLLGQGHLRPIKVQATVVWCRAHEGNFFEAGFCFAKRLNYRDLQLLT